MNHEEYLKKIIYLKELIEKERTGSPLNLANRLGVSISTIYRYLKTLRNIGIDVKYSKIRESYYIENSIITINEN